MKIQLYFFLLTVLFLVVHSTPCTAQAMCDSINHKIVYLPKDVDTPPTFVNGPEPLLRCCMTITSHAANSCVDSLFIRFIIHLDEFTQQIFIISS